MFLKLIQLQNMNLIQNVIKNKMIFVRIFPEKEIGLKEVCFAEIEQRGVSFPICMACFKERTWESVLALASQFLLLL